MKRIPWHRTLLAGLLVGCALCLLQSTLADDQQLLFRDFALATGERASLQKAVSEFVDDPEASSQWTSSRIGTATVEVLGSGERKLVLPGLLPGSIELRLEPLAGQEGLWYFRADEQTQATLRKVGDSFVGTVVSGNRIIDLVPFEENRVILFENLSSTSIYADSAIADQLMWPSAASDFNCSSTCSNQEIEVEVYVAPKARSHFGTLAAAVDFVKKRLDGLAAGQIDGVNDALQEAGACTRLVVNTPAVEVSALAGSPSNNDLTGEPAFAKLHDLFGTPAANLPRRGDVALVLVKRESNTKPGYGPIFPSHPNAIVVLDVAEAWPRLAHEMGHILGGGHWGTTDPKPRPHAEGAFVAGPLGNTATLVASSFLAPFSVYSDGGPDGDLQHNNACMFRESAPVIASYHP